ncbi:MAG: DNA polymerase III subunit gamma/tau [Arenicellales bacterium]
MSYQALARKWRPKRFADVVGQAHVVNALRNALEQDRVHHAFLFSGTRGVGKTTLARVLAKALNCERGLAAEPCGECGTCQSVDEGRFIDLIEIDAASRTRVDDTREILDNVQYAATMGRYKIYLIDEVHMLSGHSFNALLKTLEEPPSHVKFLLATTDPQKLPATILSRCLQFNLRALAPSEIADQLGRIIEAEGLSADDAGLQILARAASGSMRDALSLMDQSIAFGKGDVLGENVREMLGMIESHHVDALLRALVNHEAEALVQITAQMSERSLDYVTALDELLMVLHNASLYQVAPKAVAAKQEESELVSFLASSLTPEDIQLYYQIGLHGKRDLPLAPDAASGFEMTLLRMLSFRPDEEDSPAQEGNGRTTTPAPKAPSGAQRPGSLRPKIPSAKAQDKTPDPLERNGLAQPQAKMLEPKEKARASATTDTVGAHDALGTAKGWAAFVEQAGFKGLALELAMNLAPVSYDGASRALSVSLAASLGSLHNKARQAEIETALTGYCKETVVLILTTDQEATAETPSEVKARLEKEEKERAYRDLMADPDVQDLLSAFDATLIPESVTPGKLQRKSE